MLSYRTHVYLCAMAATAEATKLALALSMCVSDQLRGQDTGSAIDRHLPGLIDGAATLRSSVDNFIATLPPENDSWRGATGLSRHLWFIEKRLNEKSPALCAGDPVDIASNDLPEMLREFEKWYEHRSPTHVAFMGRLDPHISAGRLNSAIREAWPIFKTHMIAKFSLPAELDGHGLADRLFGKKGATAGILLDDERTGYLNLFKGMYTVNRNPSFHNDVEANPDVELAVLALINAALIRIDQALSDSIADSSTGVPD